VVIDATGMPQSALVIGGSSDIALATLRLLVARRLRRAVLVGRDQAALSAAGTELTQLGLEAAHLCPFDLASGAAIEPLVDEAVGILGPVDVMVMAAGHLGTSQLDHLGAGEVARSVAVNFTTPASLLVAMAKVMVAQGYGRLVVISSVAGARTRKDNFVYGSAKAGLDGFALGLGDALYGTGVDVMVVRPGFVHSKMTAGMKPAPLAVSPAVVARAIVRGLDEGRSVVWSPPALAPLFALLRLVPQPLWRRLSV
jgi:decaprenylphospho-beta-D-erythro-pentofuranosid-2-ulose 2-reductase